jgi:hypothetical protein
MPTQAQKRFRRLTMRDLQIACEADPVWKTLRPSEKLRRRMSKLSSFELNEGALHVNSQAKQERKRLKAIAGRAWDGWTSDFAALLLISFEATRHINRIARRDPAFVKKFAYALGAWPLICKNKAKLNDAQCVLLDAIGIARPKEFRVGASHTTSKDKVDSREAEFVFLWMQDYWRRRHVLGEDAGSGAVMFFLGDKIWPRWYVKRRADVSERLNALNCDKQRPILDALALACELPTSTDPLHHRKWSALAVQIYSAMISAGVRLTSSKACKKKGCKSQQKNMPRSLFKKYFQSILTGRPGAGRPRKRKGALAAPESAKPEIIS